MDKELRRFEMPAAQQRILVGFEIFVADSQPHRSSSIFFRESKFRIGPDKPFQNINESIHRLPVKRNVSSYSSFLVTTRLAESARATGCHFHNLSIVKEKICQNDKKR